MYSSGYTQVSKASPQGQKKMQYRSKGKSCGYYLRIIFFFSSLIQSLIIVSLVLFLVYGKTQDSASTVRIQDLEESFSRLSIENVALRQQRRNLTNLLNVTLTEKSRNDWDLLRLRLLSNNSVKFIQDLDVRLQQTNIELMMCKNQARFSSSCPQPQLQMMPQSGGCGLQMERLNAQLELMRSNFTHTTQRMRMEMDQIAKDRDNLNLEAIELRRRKSIHEKEIELNRQRCKQDFVQSLSGVSNVSRAFLLKIESLFPTHIAFQLTCEKQREHLEQIRTNCTSLSREVEDRFQSYLNNVGDQMSEIQSENSRLKAENMRRSYDYRLCSQNRTDIVLEHRRTLEKLQLKHDKDSERLLLEKMRLSGDIEVLESSVNYKSKEMEHLKDQLRKLNMSCIAKTGFGGLPGAGGGQFGRAGSYGLGSSNVGFTGLNPSIGSTGPVVNRFGSTGSSSPGSTGVGSNRQGSTGLGSSSPSSAGSFNRQGSTGLGSSSLGSTGIGLNKLGSTGLGSSSLGSTASGVNKLGSPGLGSPSLASTGLGLNKLGSTGLGSSSLGSSGSGSNKLGSTGWGSSSPGTTGLGSSKLGSTGSGSSSLGSTGLGSSKLGSTGLGSSSLGSTGLGSNKLGSSGMGSSSTGSTGSSLNKQGSTGLGSSGLGSTGSGFNKQGSTGLGSSGLGSTGSGLNKQGSTGSSSSGLGSTGSGLNKFGSTGLGSSSYGSTGLGLNKQGSTGLGTSGLGSNNKPTSSLKSSSSLGSITSGLFGFGSSNGNAGQSKPGIGVGRGTSSGSSLGTGRTSGLGGGSVSLAQHLQDLQRFINPSYGNEDRQELSRMMG